MDYAEMVSQIMAAEQGAKVLAEESRARRQQLQAGLDEEISAMRESYLARARQRLEQVQQTEEAAAEEALDRLDRKLEQTMRAVEASYEKNKERWVDTLFSLIVGVQREKRGDDLRRAVRQDPRPLRQAPAGGRLCPAGRAEK